MSLLEMYGMSLLLFQDGTVLVKCKLTVTQDSTSHPNPWSSKLGNFEYWVLSQVVWVLSRGVWVLSQEHKETKNLSTHVMFVAIVMYSRHKSFHMLSILVTRVLRLETQDARLETRDLRLETWDSILDSLLSILDSWFSKASRIEYWVFSQDCQLTSLIAG